MVNDRLNGLAVLAIHKHIKLDYALRKSLEDLQPEVQPYRLILVDRNIGARRGGGRARCHDHVSVHNFSK